MKMTQDCRHVKCTSTERDCAPNRRFWKFDTIWRTWWFPWFLDKGTVQLERQYPHVKRCRGRPLRATWRASFRMLGWTHQTENGRRFRSNALGKTKIHSSPWQKFPSKSAFQKPSRGGIIFENGIIFSLTKNRRDNFHTRSNIYYYLSLETG